MKTRPCANVVCRGKMVLKMVKRKMAWWCKECGLAYYGGVPEGKPTTKEE